MYEPAPSFPSRRGLPVALLGLALAACTGSGPIGGDTDVRAANATEVGPFGADRSLVTVDIGERTGGFTSQVSTLVVQPRRLADDKPAAWAILLTELDKDATQYANTATHLASWGFIVLVPQFDNLGSRRSDTELLVDIAGLVDAVKTDAVQTELRTSDEIGIAGHGRGGRVALLALAGNEDLGAAFAISPVDGDGTDEDVVSVAPGLGPQLDKPVGLFGAGRGDDVADGADGACTPEGDNYEDIWAVLQGAGVKVDLPDGGHGDIVEDCINGTSDAICTACRAGRDPVATVNVARAGMAAHFGVHLRNDASLGAFWNTSFLDELAPNARVAFREVGDPPIGVAPGDTGL